jgi:hypothetical protein
MSARGRARADAQGRCDGAGSERNRLYNPPVWRAAAPEGCSPLYYSPVPRQARRHPWVHMPISFGEAPEQTPWVIKREDRPAAVAGRSCLTVSMGIGYAVLLHRRVSYPTSEGASNQAVPLSARNSEKLAGNHRENIGGRQCQTLHVMARPIALHAALCSKNPPIVSVGTTEIGNPNPLSKW